MPSKNQNSSPPTEKPAACMAMNEAKWSCTHCKRINFQGVKGILETNDIVECEYCKMRSIIESMVYILQTRLPE